MNIPQLYMSPTSRGDDDMLRALMRNGYLSIEEYYRFTNLEVYPNYLEPEIRPEYTLVVRDLIDNNYRYGDTDLTGDLTSGYTIKQLENSLGTTWNQWRINIINDHTNNSEQHVQNTFDFWN